MPSWFIYGATGYGSRITVAMNVNNGKEIGHPCSNYVWDIVSFAENCFQAIGLQYKLYLGEGYNNTARYTSAQSNRFFSEAVEIIDNFEDELIVNGPFIFANPDGNWYYSNITNEPISNNYQSMPFGPIIVSIHGIKKKKFEFPKSSLNYLINTLERGEEPMEIAGKGGYSAVSGWKAFARWMQAYSIPGKGLRHENLKNLSILLLERRRCFVKYWEELSKKLKIEKEIIFANKLSAGYRKVIPFIEKLISEGDSLRLIREFYFAEQKILPIYKSIHNYLKNTR